MRNQMRKYIALFAAVLLISTTMAGCIDIHLFKDLLVQKDEEDVAALEELKGIDGLEESIAALEDLEGEGAQETQGLAGLKEQEIGGEEEASDAQLKCPSCGSPITMDMKQCPKCGTEFEFI